MNPTPVGMTPVVSFEDVSKVYGKVRAVDRLSLELWPGHMVAFLGPNGRASRCRWTCCSRCASRPAAESAAILMGFVAAPHERWAELARCMHGTEHAGDDATTIRPPAASL